MLIKKYPVICLLAVLLFGSCYKDLGNYDYKDINEVKFLGIEKEYTVLLGERFQLTPELVFTDEMSRDTSNYTFEWVGIRQDGVLAAEKREEIATTCNLDLVITLPAAPYRVYYLVTDKKTGVQWQTYFKLNVVSTIYEGWLLLNDVNGKARLDMISIKDSQPYPIIDVLATTGSKLQPAGKPRFVYTYAYQPGTYGIYIGTDESTYRIHPETFDWEPSYNITAEMLGSTPAGFHATNIASPSGSMAYFQADDNVYFYYRTFQIYYSFPINVMKGETQPFRASPFIAATNSPAAVLYDIDARKFVRHINSEASTTDFPAGSLFDYNTGKDLVYMTYSTFGNGEVFAILKDPADGKLYLARFTFPRTSSPVQVYYDEITATDIENAEQFAVSPDLGYILYNAGGKLYEYDMSVRSAKLMLDKGTNPISYIGFNKSVSRNKLIVASYDPATEASGAGGTLEFFTVPQVQGDLVLDTAYTGFGKIIGVDYRVR